MVTISVRSPSREVFRFAVAGGTARIAVSDGFMSRAFSSFTQPQPLMFLRASSAHSLDTRNSLFVSHLRSFGLQLLVGVQS